MTYTPNEVTGNVDLTATGLVTPEEQALLENIPVSGQTGDVIDVSVPAVPGYTTDQTTVTATVNPNGTITPNATIVYTPNKVTDIVTIPSNKGDQTVPNITGTVGTTVEVDVPEVEGYTPDKTTVPATVNPDGTITVDQDTGTVNYTPATHDYTITPVDGSGKPIPGIIATPKTGTTDDVIDSKTYPDVPGYTADTTEVKVPTGDTAVNVVYTPKNITATVTIPSNKGNQTVPNITGTVGTTVEVDVPEVEGYTPDKDTVPATVNPDGTITVDQDTGTVNYTPATHAYTITPVDKAGNPIPGTVAKPENGTTDDVIDSKTYPEVPGYTADKTAVKVPTTDTAVQVAYTPNTVSATIAIPATGLSTPAEKEKLNVPANGVTNQDITVTIPDVTGYTHDKTTITAHVTPEGTITSTDLVTYTPNAVQTTTIIPSTGLATPAEQKLLTDVPVSGHTDETVTITVPTVEGYTTTQKTTTVTINPDGTVTPNETITYTPKNVTATVTIPSNKGDQVVTDVPGVVGETVNVTVPTLQGYTADKTTVPAIVNPDGTITTAEKVEYTGNPVTATVTIPSNKGDQIVPNITGTVGTTVEVDVPKVEGYTPDKDTVPATVNPDGTITLDQPTTTVTYTPANHAYSITPVDESGKPILGITATPKTGTTDDVIDSKTYPDVPGYTARTTAIKVPTSDTNVNVVYTPNTITATVTIPSNEGDQVVTNVPGTVGETVDVPVPNVPGYTPDKTTVPATVNPDDTITVNKPDTEGTVTYTANSQTVGVVYTGVTAQPTQPTITGVTDGTASYTPDQITGYTPDQTSYTVQFKLDANGQLATPTLTVHYTGNAITADVVIPSNKDDQTVPNVTGTIGTTINVTVPTLQGYTADKTTVPATVNPDGTITPTEKVEYTGNPVTTDVTIPSNKGAQVVTNVPGTVGETVDVTVPNVPGYTPDKTMVPATVNPDGTITTTEKVEYTGNPVTATVTIPSNKGNQVVTDVPGVVGETVDVTVPEVEGYTPDKATVPATVNPDGTITTTEKVEYTGNPVTATVTIPSNKGNQVVTDVPGIVGETVDVTVPEVEGYTPDKATVPATVNPDGTITTTEKVEYTGNPVTADVTIPSNKGNQVVTNVPGIVGETVDVTVPTVEGYTPDKDTVPATVNPDGTITPTEKVEYTGNPVTADVTIPSNKGNQVVTNVPGTVGETVDVPVPNVPGYTPDKTTVPATVNPDGTITPTEKVEYTGNPVTADVTIPSNKGDQVVTDVPGTVGETVDVTVPTLPGYKQDQTTVPATVNPDGTITTTTQVIYTPETQTVTFTVPTTPETATTGLVTDGEKQQLTIDVTGKTDEPVQVDVPTIAGYTADKTSMTVTIDGNGQATTTDQVTYTPNSITLTVNNVDQDDGDKVISTTTYTGKTDRPTTDFVPQTSGYTVVKTTMPDTTPNANGTVTVTLQHVITQGTYQATRTISYAMQTGDTLTAGLMLPDQISQTVAYTTAYDEATQITTYTPEADQSFAAVTSPTLTGYTADSDAAAATVATTTTKPEALNVTVTYAADTVSYTVVPTDLSGNPLYGTTDVPETGKTNTPITLPTLPGYTPIATTQVVPGTSQTLKVVYVPVPNYGTVGENNTPADGSIVTDPSHVYQKAVQPAAVNPDDQTVTITPVDLSGNPLYGHTPITIPGVAGYAVQVPELAGYTPTTTMITPTNGVNQVVYVPNSNYGTVGLNTSPSDGSIVNDPDHVYQKVSAPEDTNTDGQTVTIMPIDHNGNPLYGQAPFEAPGVAGYEMQVPDLPGYTATVTTITPTNDVNQVVYVPNAQLGTNNTPADGNIISDPDHVFQKVSAPEDTNTDGQTVTITPIDYNGQPLYGQAPFEAPGVAGYEMQVPDLPGYTAIATTITPTNDVNQVVYVPNAHVGTNVMPADGSIANDSNHVYQKVAQPVATSIDMDAGHALPSDTADVSNSHVYEKATQPAGVNPNGKKVTITPVDLSGQPLYGHTPITIPGVAGYQVQVPDLAGYTPTQSTITPINGVNQVVYVPNPNYGTVGVNTSPSDGSIVADSSHVYEKDVQPEGTSIDMDAGHALPSDTADVSNTHVYEKDVQPAGASIDMDAGHVLPGDTAAISNTHVYEKDVQPAGSYIDMDAGHALPGDTAEVSNTHVYEKDVQPAGSYIDMDAGHALPSDTADVSNTHVYEKDVQPEGASIDMDAGHALPGDTAKVSNVHVYEKDVQPAGSYIDMDAGHALPGDTAEVSNVHVYEKDARPLGAFIDMDAGHALPSDTAAVSNIHVYEKDVQPEGASIDMDAGHALPNDTADVSNIHVYEKDVQPAGSYIDMDAGHALPDDTVEVSNTHVYKKDVQPEGASIDMDAGHVLPSDTANVSNIHVYEKDVQPAGASIDMDAGHALPVDTAAVSNTHVYEKDVQPAGSYIDMDAGHALPSDTADVSNIHVYEKDVQPEGTSRDMGAGHMLPSDTAPVSNTHVYKKVVTSEPNEVNWQNRTVTITPVDAKGQPIKGLAPLKVTGIAGYPVQVPTLPGYTAQLTTIVATNGANKVIYTPNQVTGTAVLPSNLGDQTVTGITGVTGVIIQVAVPQITGYTADRNTIPVRIEANGVFTPLAQVHYVAQSGDKGAATPEAITAATQQPKSTMRPATVQQASTKARTNAPITKQTNAATAKELPQTGSTTAEPTTLTGMAMLSLTAGLLGLFGKKRKKEDQ